MKTELPIWAVAANIIFEHEMKELGLLSGTKQFSGGTKVYVVLHKGDSVEVVGLARQPRRWIRVWTQCAFLANVRVEMIYSPKVASLLNRELGLVWNGSPDCELQAQRLCGRLQTARTAVQPFCHELKSANTP